MKLLGTILLAAGCAGVPMCAQRIEGGFDRTLNVSGPANLDIVTDSGGIVVRGGEPGSVRIHAVLRGNPRDGDRQEIEARIRSLEQNPPIGQNGGQIRIGHVKERGPLRHISMRFEVIAPPESTVRARADSGGIRVESIKGPVDCKADSGGIEANDIGAEVRAAADSGGIRVSNVHGPLFAHTDSGGVQANGIAGPIDIAVDSGHVHVEQTSPAAIRVRSDSGGATVKLAPAAGYDITVKSDSGRITLPEMTVRGTMSPHHAEGKVRGGGPLVDIKVDSGNVSIE